MNYLDKRITASITYTAQDIAEIPTGVYTYYLKRVDSANETVFVGNFYWNGESTYTFDITDVISNDCWVVSEDDLSDGIDTDINLISTYRVQTAMNTADDETPHVWYSNSVTVAKVYPYPNLDKNFITNPNNTFFELGSYSAYYIYVLRQGWTRLTDYSTNITPDWGALTNPNCLVPEYPLFEYGQDMEECKYPLGVTFEVGSDVENVYLRAKNASADADTYLGQISMDCNASYSTHSLITECGGFFQSQDNPTEDIYVYLYSPDNDNTSLVAKYNRCYSRYYLFWQDRFGSFQSQPFGDDTTYTESFNVAEVQDYQNRRKKANIQVQPKWKVSSGWIRESVFPLYESIYTSPVLMLLDTQTLKTHNVIVSGNYTEKTYKNQKSLINLSLELEEDKKQNIIY